MLCKTRRKLLIGAALFLPHSLLPTQALGALPRKLWPKSAFRAMDFDQAVLAITQGAEIRSTNQIRIRLPVGVNDGRSVRIAVSTSLPRIIKMSLLVKKNPIPLVSSCRVAPPALPYFELSCHLNTSSEVYVLVESEQGFYSTNRHITIPNHSSLDPVYLPRLQNPTSSFTARAKREQDKHFVRMLIHHPMRYAPPDTGAGSHFIQKVICKYRSETIFTAAWGPFVATHPYLAMRLLNALPDEPVQLTWVDNRGNRDQTEVVLP